MIIVYGNLQTLFICIQDVLDKIVWHKLFWCGAKTEFLPSMFVVDTYFTFYSSLTSCKTNFTLAFRSDNSSWKIEIGKTKIKCPTFPNSINILSLMYSICGNVAVILFCNHRYIEISEFRRYEIKQYFSKVKMRKGFIRDIEHDWTF